MNTTNSIHTDLKNAGNPEKALVLQRFFKTSPGQYGEGDIFLGIAVPQLRQIAKKHPHLNAKEIKELLSSKLHEERLTALLILVNNYQAKNNKKEIVEFYLSNTKHINNWDLVDLSADKILGNYLINKDKSQLYQLAKSENIWERRIAIISTFHFIKNNQFQDTLKLAEILLQDKHDLIQKAVGWMLREVGKKDIQTLEDFLKENYKNMPRTMLRYAIEKFPEKKRQAYLKGEI